VGAFAAREALIEFEGIAPIDFNTNPGPPTPTPHIVRPDDDPTEAAPVEQSNQTLITLSNALIPENNPADLAMRLQGVEDIPLTFPDPNAPYQVGAQKDFWITNTSTNLSFQVPATLRYVTEHLNFWIGDEVRYNEDDLAYIAETFENEIYPTTRNFFGSEWSPGVDEDPHVYILYVPDIGLGTAGYFSSADELHPLAHEYSNAHEMFVINADNSPLSDPYTFGVLAHEFQHMIHWHLDRNETSWINEGFAELSAFLNGYDPGGFDYYFIGNPDYQLNDWPNVEDTGPSYGSAFLFVTYFLDRLGDEATQLLAAHTDNGLTSIDQTLLELGAVDPLTGQQLTADDLVIDWALANYLQDGDIGDGRYVYHNYPEAPRAYETETITRCDSSSPLVRDVHQYGTDYIRITCDDPYTLHFEGSIQTTLLPADSHSGKFSFWSNKGDESNMVLTRQFDFSDHSGPLTLTYWVWYDIEEGYDYVYLEASTDGENWQILTTPSGTSEDPSGNSYGWGYNGVSGRWIMEEIDLSQFSGQEVYLRFEYVTDTSVHGEGLLLDDVSILEIGYETDFEEDDGGWEGAGFVRVSNVLPQTFRVALIYVGDRETTVEYLTLDAANTAEVTIDPQDKNSWDVVLVVMGTTRFTRQNAAYQIEFLP
jgi:hypothetical protein